MNKLEWEQALTEFDKVHTKLYVQKWNFKHGSNKKKKADADREMEFSKHTLECLFKKYPEAYTIAMGGENIEGYGKAIISDEFFQNRYVVGDLGDLLLKIKEKIKSFESENKN
jgi:hypothetical protein